MKNLKKAWKNTPKETTDSIVINTTILICITALMISIFYPTFLMKVMFINLVVLIIVIVYNTALALSIVFKNRKIIKNEDEINR